EQVREHELIVAEELSFLGRNVVGDALKAAHQQTPWLGRSIPEYACSPQKIARGRKVDQWLFERTRTRKRIAPPAGIQGALGAGQTGVDGGVQGGVVAVGQKGQAGHG